MAATTTKDELSWQAAVAFLLSLGAVGAYLIGPVIAGVVTFLVWRSTPTANRRSHLWLSGAAALVAVGAILQLAAAPLAGG